MAHILLKAVIIFVVLGILWNITQYEAKPSWAKKKKRRKK